ncbi:MAG: hypothetical protein Q8920_16300 [Bacillota bacterium]|nr:hypothetical protein [Bacillota bacterium]
MIQQRNRKFPRVYSKKAVEEERVFNLSLPVAAGIAAFTFTGGVLLGYMLRKSLD